MKFRRDQSSAKLFYEDPETAYNKNLTMLMCNGVPVKSILPVLGYFLISCMRIESMFSEKRWVSHCWQDLDALWRFLSFVLRVMFVVTLYACVICLSLCMVPG